MSSPASSLPDAWVQRIWSAMRATYGASFDRMWTAPAGCDPVEHVRGLMAHWGRELGRFQSNPKALAYALDHLPPTPPNLVEFRALCNRCPEAPRAAIAGPAPDPQRVQRVIEGIGRPAEKSDPLALLRELAESDARDGTFRGQKVTQAQRQTYRQALGMREVA